MAVIRAKKYTVISNDVFTDNTLSLGAKGLLCQMFSFQDGMDISEEKLSALFNDSRTTIRNALNELEQAGYLKRTVERTDDGKLQSVCIAYETKNESEEV